MESTEDHSSSLVIKIKGVNPSFELTKREDGAELGTSGKEISVFSGSSEKELGKLLRITKDGITINGKLTVENGLNKTEFPLPFKSLNSVTVITIDSNGKMVRSSSEGISSSKLDNGKYIINISSLKLKEIPYAIVSAFTSDDTSVIANIKEETLEKIVIYLKNSNGITVNCRFNLLIYSL